MKKFLVQKHSNLTSLPEYFDFNGINYEPVELFRTDLEENGCYDVPTIDHNDNGNIVLIINDLVFQDLIEMDIPRIHLLDFIRNKNKIIFYQDADASMWLDEMSEAIKKLDSEILPGSIMYIHDQKFSSSHWTTTLKNSLVRRRIYSPYMRVSRIHHSGTEKSIESRAYMVTTIMRKNRPHREELYNQLIAKKSLFDQGICVFHSNRKDNDYEKDWHGTKPILQTWCDGYPSPDLYKNAYVEVVPETLAKDVHYFTEKTTKPISTKTPFLMVSSLGYLDYLKSLGFKTFSHLISEKYDSEDRVEDRIKLMLEQLEDIVKNGAREFYLASQDVLEHNQRKLAEIAGLWDIHSDEFYAQCLKEVDQ